MRANSANNEFPKHRNSLKYLFIQNSVLVTLETQLFQSGDFSQPEHMSSTEDHIKLKVVQFCGSFRHLCSLAKTGLLQQKLSWKERKMRVAEVLLRTC